MQSRDVFISYSSDARDLKDQVVSDIESQGIRAWIAPRDLPAGADWNSGITQGIQSSKIVITILSTNTTENVYQMSAIKLAVSHNKDIIMIKARRNAEIPPVLFHYRFIDFSNKPDYEDNLISLVRLIKDSMPGV